MPQKSVKCVLKKYFIYGIIVWSIFNTMPVVHAGYMHSDACGFVGISLGYRTESWHQIIRSQGVREIITLHCTTKTCDRRARNHYSMVYETMPCDPRCIDVYWKRYQKACLP
ncbi:hypothetical protein ACQZV8_15155 [Magnetococcales bacterium HHB-1]